MFLEVRQHIKYDFTKILSLLRANIFNIVLLIVLLLNSGVCYLGFGATSKIKIFVYAGTLLLLLALFVLTRSYKVFKIKQEKPKASIPRLIFSNLWRSDVLSIVLILVVSAINFVLSIFSGGVANANSVMGIILCFLFSFLIVQIYTKETFLKVFSNMVTIVSVVALVFFTCIYLSKVNFNTSSFFSEMRMYDSYFYIFYDYTGGLTNNTLTRLMGIFWEPGLFANFLLIGLIIELFYKNKCNWVKVILFLVCLLLTKSTTGYIVLFIIFFAYLSKIAQKSISYVILITLLILFFGIFLFYEPIFSALAKFMPSVFGKMVTENSSLLTRLESSVYFFRVFTAKPLIGWGFDRALVQYNYIKPAYIDSATATFPYIIASIGVLGFVFAGFVLLGLLRFSHKKLFLSTRIILLVCFFIISNMETQVQVLGILCLYFYGVKEISRFRLKEDAYSPNNKTSVLSLIASRRDSKSFSKNIVGSILLKGGAILLGLITIPVMSKFFKNDDLYGAWLAIVSILTLILNFDFGVTDGLKNKLINAIKDKDDDKVKTLISTSYFLTFAISLALFAIGMVIIWFIDWNSVLNISSDLVNIGNMRVAITLIILTICLELPLRNVVSILSAYGKIILANSMMVITNLFLIIFAFAFQNVNFNKILLMACGYLVFVTLPLIIASIYCFSKVSKHSLPTFGNVNKEVAKVLSNLGIRFFIIQICNIILWGINSFLISSLYGPADVVAYQKYYKLFSTIISLFAIFQPTLWVYFAFAKKEKNFNKIKKLLLITGGLSLALAGIALICGLAAQFVFDIWLGSASLKVNNLELIPFVLYGVLYSAFAMVSVLCYSLEILKTFTITALVIGILKLPLVFLGKYLFPEWSWAVVMWINVILIIPYVFIPTIEIIFNLKRYKNGSFEQN